MGGGKARIQVEITYAAGEASADVDRLAELVESVCARFGLTSAEVSIAIVDDAAIQKTNEEFLGHAFATDVISFDLSEEGVAAFDLVVNAQEAARQSLRRGHSVEAELALYVVHGLLHHLGFDDQQAADAERMHSVEDSILQEAGYGGVYSRPEGD